MRKNKANRVPHLYPSFNSCYKEFETGTLSNNNNQTNKNQHTGTSIKLLVSNKFQSLPKNHSIKFYCLEANYSKVKFWPINSIETITILHNKIKLKINTWIDKINGETKHWLTTSEDLLLLSFVMIQTSICTGRPIKNWSILYNRGSIEQLSPKLKKNKS
jgi:hypothetical protein